MASHYWEGNPRNTVAFVFSTPGRVEAENDRPVSGDTGENMDAILAELSVRCPDLFPSLDRYYYRITNSSPTVMYATKDNGRTEEYGWKITEGENIRRVLEEIGRCSVVILCGRNAQRLQGAIREKVVITVCHLGNKGLRNEYPNSNSEM